MEMTASQPRKALDPMSTRSFALWFGILGPPLAWFIHLFLGDLIFEWGCAPSMRSKQILGLSLDAWTMIETIVFLAVTVGGGVLALLALRDLRRRTDGASLERAIAMAYVGVASSLLYGMILVFGLLPSLVLPSCLPPP